ncbi:MAG: HipA domain-containing protein [Methyloligella sp. ZOD6]
MNDSLVGYLMQAPEGNLTFRYDESWLARKDALPASIMLPLREEPFAGPAVLAAFDNLLPDSESQRRTISEQVRADGADTFSLLKEIGRDCAGALQFTGEDGQTNQYGVDPAKLDGEPLDAEALELLLQGLPSSPLGLTFRDNFRVSVAGAQKKTALLFHDNRWFKPGGMTPTTHILKTQIGKLPTGTDLSNSVENEYYCLKLTEAFGLPVAAAEIHTFGATRALVVERFDRKRTEDGKIVRLHQEDMCQALSIHPSIKYERQGGPGVVQILRVLEGSEDPARDQEIVLKAQLIFWLIGATDGHAKNFSILMESGKRFRLAPLYDILTVEPSIVDGSARGLDPRLAMSVGAEWQHTIANIEARHFIETSEEAGLPRKVATRMLEEIAELAPSALAAAEADLAPDVSTQIQETVNSVVHRRLGKLQHSLRTR